MNRSHNTDSAVSDHPDELYEVVDGQVVELPPMDIEEIELTAILGSRLLVFGHQNNLGRAEIERLFTLHRRPKLQLRPDVAFVTYRKWPRAKCVPNTSIWDMVPELVVVIVNFETLAVDLIRKISLYFAAGVERVWVAYPTAKQVYVYRSPTDNDILTESDELDGEHIIPGFRFPLKDWF